MPDETPRYTTQILKDVLETLHKSEEKVVDVTKLRYVLYVRKSTESAERQAKSLEDQIDDCRKMAEDKNLKIVGKPIIESESAKEPDIRPKFMRMIADIKEGKYDGIIAWHPDRLARNMKDAGEIIDLLDKGIIRDLQFFSFSFQNDVGGKMMLGVAFVLSKQYSDQLSINVKRGMRKRTEEGKYLSKAKHGYYKDTNQYLQPDGNNFAILKEAWKLRLEGKMLETIAQFVNDKRYSIPTTKGGTEHEIHMMDKKRLSLIFRDPFYAGVLDYGGSNVVDLTQVRPDFVPMVTVDQFMQINKISNLQNFFKQKFKGRREGEIKADLLRGKVICGYCKREMSSQIVQKDNAIKGLTYYYSYRCDTRLPRKCRFYGKAVRAQVVTEFAFDFLDTHKFDSKEAYDHYLSEMKSVIAAKTKELDSRRRSLLMEKSQLEEKIVKNKNYLRDETDASVKDMFKEDLKGFQARVTEINGLLDEMLKEKGKNQAVVISYDKFLELFADLPVITRKTKNIKELDFILGKIFLNFVTKDKKVLSCKLNPPFDRFVEVVKDAAVSSSRGERT